MTAKFDPADPTTWPVTLSVDQIADVLVISKRSVFRLAQGTYFPRRIRLSRKTVRWPRGEFLAYVRFTAPEMLPRDPLPVGGAG